LNTNEIKISINELRLMLENDYEDFEVWLSENTETVKIKSKTNPDLPIIVIGR
jgi:hypothetical protein